MAERAAGRLGRRRVIGSLGALAAAPWAMMPWCRAHAMTQAMAAEVATSNDLLLVAGPANGRLGQWANLLCPLIGPALAAGGVLSWTPVGAADGVTAANQFDAEVSPDGDTAMLLPGTAALAQLIGDPRARFDAGAWVAGFAGVSSTVVMGRAPLAELYTSPQVVVLAADPAGADLPTLLGLSLLGFNVKPVRPESISADIGAALAKGTIDVATLSEAAVSNVPRWQQAGIATLFTLGTIGESGAFGVDPAFPAVPTLQNLLLAKGTDTTRPLPTAWRALAAAKQLTLGLVLPQLTPASRVAQWRLACASSIASLTIQAIAAAESLRLATQPTAAMIVAAVTAPADAQLELHQWLANRLGWRPS